MTKRLNHQDRAAVDMLLDQHASSHHEGHPAAAMATLSSRKRLHAAEKLLSILDIWQPAVPSADLTVRTLRRIQDADEERTNAAHPRQPETQHPRPVV
ncbi:MAG: hypothetical protein IT446_09030 [Phycisphaerales bacterium]|nr:hypothetical protein [Phycisphaerales bacterium]